MNAMINKYDLIIVGAGPAGIFTCLELIYLNALKRGKKILLIDQGKAVEKRKCPIKKLVNA